MHGVIMATKMMADIVYLGMAVVATSDAVIGTGSYNLIKFHLAIGAPRFGKTRLQETATTTAAVVVRFIGSHLDDVFLANHRLHDKAQIIGRRITKALADDLAGILHREFNLAVLVPGRADLQLALADPFRVIGVDRSNLKVVLDTEFFQSRPD